MTRPYTYLDLKQFLEAQKIQATLIREIGDTPTVATAAEALGVETDRILKTLMLWIQPSKQELTEPIESAHPPYLVVVSYGERRICKKKLAQHFGVGRKRMRMASPEQVIQELGYAVGGVSPLGHRHKHPIFLDQGILSLPDGEESIVYAGGGDDTTMMKIKVQELIHVLEPTLIDLSE